MKFGFLKPATLLSGNLPRDPTGAQLDVSTAESNVERRRLQEFVKVCSKLNS